MLFNLQIRSDPISVLTNRGAGRIVIKTNCMMNTRIRGYNLTQLSIAIFGHKIYIKTQKMSMFAQKMNEFIFKSHLMRIYYVFSVKLLLDNRERVYGAASDSPKTGFGLVKEV